MQSPESPVQLLVEGANPIDVFRRFCTSWDLPSIEIRNFGGISDLRDYLETFVRASGFSAVAKVGIIRDAEGSAESAFRSVQSSLRHAGLQVPATPGESTFGSPSISVLIIPDVDSEGNLESLLWRSIEEKTEATCINEFLACLDLGNIAVTRRDKARIQAYLASKPHPHGSVGVAANRGQWDPEHGAFSEVRRFLTSLNDGKAFPAEGAGSSESANGVSGESR